MKFSGVIKRALCVAMIAVLLTLTAAPALAASAKNPHGAYVVATSNKYNRLRVRASAGGYVKDYLKRGDIVVYRSDKNGWWYVRYRGGSGYVDRRNLWSVDYSTSKCKYTSVDNLWVHTKPSNDSWCYGKLKPGKLVTIEKQSGSWVKIKYNGYTGWVYAIYLRRVK